jgi:hypothetical protein
MSVLGAFTTQLVNFFDELCTTFPEEREVKMATEAIKGAKKINPRLMLDLFYDHVYVDCAEAISRRDVMAIRQIAQRKISTQFNEMISALSIFDKYWDSMGSSNQEVIWQYMTVLCRLAERVKSGA